MLRALDCSECYMHFRRGKLITFLLGESPTICLHEKCGRKFFIQHFICTTSYRGQVVRATFLSRLFLLGWEEEESLTMDKEPRVPACRLVLAFEVGWTVAVSLSEEEGGSFPHPLHIQGPSWTLKSNPRA